MGSDNKEELDYEIDMAKLEDRHLKTLLPILREFHNETEDFSAPHLRNSLKPYFTSIVTIYLIILLASIAANLSMISHIFRSRSIRSKSQQVTFSMLFGNCLNDIIVKDVLVLPFSVLILLTLHWTQGSFACYTFPMLQDVCFYATSITFLLIFNNRYKMATKVGLLGNLNEVCNDSFGLPAFWSILLAWIISFVGVIPYTIYIEFIDLSHFIPNQKRGNGFCVVNLDGNIQEYIRVLFISFYIVPIALVAYFHARTTTLMKSWPGYESINFEISLISVNTGRGHATGRSSVEEALVDSSCGESTISCQTNHHNQMPSLQALRQPNVLTEKGSQHILMIMFFVHTLCLFPINILRISKHVVIETHENSFAFDVVFVIFVAIQFSSTAIIPIVYHLWTSGSALFGIDLNRYLYVENHAISGNRRTSRIISNEQITNMTDVSVDSVSKI